ncbi:MAG: flavodoxin family protein [Moraxellaceae bacterium]|nr:flavodoxin family protein [Moraxellaceae bacterium]MDZ4386331.1 flavodoxin family protein [Moraxellaceae bacterium]
MAKIVVAYHSGGGHTARLAEAVQNGAAQVPQVEVILCEITAAQINARGRWHDAEINQAIEDADGVIFGCPTLMGMVSAPFKAFMEGAFEPWARQGWKDKFAGGFTNSSSLNGDKTNTQIQLLVFAAQMAMMWIPMGDHPGANWSGGGMEDDNRLGAFLGPMSQAMTDLPLADSMFESDLRTGHRYGERFAQIVRHWTREGDYATERVTDRATAAAMRARSQQAVRTNS